MRINRLVTHVRPHIDEYVGIWLLRKFGAEMFPGVEAAEVIYWNTGGIIPDGRTPEEYEKEGALLIGVGGGRFDEHPSADNGRKEEYCAATLIAEALGFQKDPALQKILTFTLNNDLKGVASPFDLAYLTKLLHEQYPDDPERVMNWVMMGIEAKYQEQAQFFATREEFKKNARVEEMKGPKGDTIPVVIVVSDNVQMSKFARSAHGCQAAIVIQKRSPGNVFIHTNQQLGIKLYDVVRMMRIRERELNKWNGHNEWKALEVEGRVEGAENIWFQEKTNAILNGSLTATDVPPTKIPLEEIVEIIRIGIDPSRFEPSRAARCKEGVCNSSSRNPCSWYRYGLRRCRTVRYEMSQKK
ncbi:MAG: hypothetical protein V1885_03050 [Candidatus Brennerbacteria bacterium]